MTTPQRRGPDRPEPAPDLYAEAEIRSAARALLRRPLLAAGTGHDEALALVRRHRVELARLFADGLGYRLVVEPGLARLFKAGLGADATRGLRRRNDALFTPRRYALLSPDPGRAHPGPSSSSWSTSWWRRFARRPSTPGWTSTWTRSPTGGRCTRRWSPSGDLGVLTSATATWSTGPSGAPSPSSTSTATGSPCWSPRRSAAVEAPDELLDVAAVPSAAGGARVAVRRRLAESPVLSMDDLTEEQHEWWRRNRNREREWFRRTAGPRGRAARRGCGRDRPRRGADRPGVPAGGLGPPLRAAAARRARQPTVRAERRRALAEAACGQGAGSTARSIGDRVFGSGAPASRKCPSRGSGRPRRGGARDPRGAAAARRDDGGSSSTRPPPATPPDRHWCGPGRTGERSLFDEEDV